MPYINPNVARTLPPDPQKFARLFWPRGFSQIDGEPYYFYDKQWDIVYSVEDTYETIVPAGKMLGKDFVAGFICVKQALCNEEFRIVTTSVDDPHLNILWGEIGRFISTSAIPITQDKGGPLLFNHRHIRRYRQDEDHRNADLDTFSYMIGRVSELGEGMAGHHARYTLGVIDEASGVRDRIYTEMIGWAKRLLIFGNCNPCSNFFYRMIEEEGEILLPEDTYDEPTIIGKL
jgi:hypothetical protein